MRSNRFIKLILVGVVILSVLFFLRSSLVNSMYYYGETIDQSNRDFSQPFLELQSKCACRQNVTVQLLKSSTFYQIKLLRKRPPPPTTTTTTTTKTTTTLKPKNSSNSTTKPTMHPTTTYFRRLFHDYILDKEAFEKSILTCDLYNSLRRGPNLKIVSYALTINSNSSKQTLDDIRGLMKQFKQLYPDWFVRFYYDNTVDMDFVCEMECLQYDTSNVLKDFVDFCNVQSLPYDLVYKWNARFMNEKTWNWLPIGDGFVDYVSIRDTNSWITSRELDSVMVWLNSNDSVFHIMRDAPFQNSAIVNGAWGMSPERDRNLANYLFKIITNKRTLESLSGQKLDENTISNANTDRLVLDRYFASHLTENSSTIHDSYSCAKLGGSAWPSKRPSGYCYVGCRECCQGAEKEEFDFECPAECRPSDHPDWIFC